MSEPLVYFATCADLALAGFTKIGSCGNWVDRSSTYKTSYPLHNIKPYCIIITERHTLVETIFLKEFKEFSSVKHEDYKDGGTEWITKKLSIKEIKDVLNKHPTIICRLLEDAELDKYLDDAERKVRELQEEKQKKLNEEYELYIETLNEEIFPYELRGCQPGAANKIERHFQTENSCIVNWPCGLGKTILSLYIIRSYNTILIGVPSALLVIQWVQLLQKCFPLSEILAIMSSSVEDTTKSVENTTDTEYVNGWILGKKQYIIVTTYHSFSVVQHLSFNLKVLDECHHLCQTNTDSKFYKILHVKSEKQLALTATLKAVDNEQKIDNFDEKLFGKIIDIKSTLWAIENKYITDYEIITVRVEEKTLYDIMVDILGSVEHQEIFLAAFVMLESISRYPDLTHIIAYCNTRNNASLLDSLISKLLTKRFSKLENNFYQKALDSETLKHSDLKSEVKAFKGSLRGIISSVYIFGEGFDIPKLNGVCVVENMQSEIRIVQSIMRGNRLEKNNPNKINRVILPYNENEQNTFEKVETVITKMGNQDANIEQRIRACVIGASSVSIGGLKYNVDFNNTEELDYIKLKLRHRSVLRLNGCSQIKTQYKYLRTLNVKHKVKSRSEYFSNPKIKHERLDNPPQYFEKKDPTVWRSWYDFLGVDLSVYPPTKDKWRATCAKLNITSLNYSEKWEQFGLPEHPEDLYRDFKNLQTELREKKKRRI